MKFRDLQAEVVVGEVAQETMDICQEFLDEI